MAFNFDELNIVNIWNINDKVRDDNTAIEFCQRYGLLRKSFPCVRFIETMIRKATI